MAVQNRDVAAAALERLDRLRRQADFRNEYERYLPLTHDFLDAVQQEWPKAAFDEKWLKDRPDARLIRGQRVARSLRERVGLAEQVRYTGWLRYADRRFHAPRLAASESLVYQRL